MAKAYLVLENGKVFEGESFGYEGETLGEVVFSTAMTGYLESLTDKSYFGQILVSTFPLIGNYGVIPSDFESDRVHVKGYIVGRWCQTPSNFRSEGSLDAFLKSHASLYFENVNDGTCEGLLYKNEPVFTVQFHPEGCGGPQDSDMLFDKFIAMMEEGK